MAVKKKNELLEAIRKIVGENETEDVTSLYEDITDTITDFETKSSDTTDWKSKHDELDKSWRKKFNDRFFNSSSNEPEKNIEDGANSEDENEIEEKTKFEDLFEEVKGE